MKIQVVGILAGMTASACETLPLPLPLAPVPGRPAAVEVPRLALSDVTASGLPMSPQAPAAAVELKSWLDHHFSLVGQSCFPNFTTRLAGDSPTPYDVRTWEPIAQRLGYRVWYYDSASLSDMFSRVYSGADERSATLLDAQPIGVTYPRSAATVLYQNRSNLRRDHNCSTLLAASLKSDVRVSVADLKAAVEASANSERTQTAFAYAGTMVSPVAAALNLNTTAVDAPPEVSAFSALLAIWQWYRAHPSYADAAQVRNLWMLNQIDGAAVYRVSGLTQRDMLGGSSSLEAAVPFVSATASASATIRRGSTTTLEEYSVVSWDRRFVHIPAPDQVAAQAGRIARFELLEGAPTQTDGSPFTYTMVLAEVPSNYCRANLWTLEQNQRDAGLAELGQFSMNAVPQTLSRCQISVRVQPPPSGQETGSASVGFTLVSQIDLPGGTQPVVMRLAPPIVHIRDTRASVSLNPPSGLGTLILPNDGGTTNFRFRTSYNGLVQAATEARSKVIFACGESQEIVPSSIQIDATNKLLTVTVAAPDDILALAQSAVCSISGEFHLKTDEGFRTVAMSSAPLMIRKRTPPAPAPADPASLTPGANGPAPDGGQ